MKNNFQEEEISYATASYNTRISSATNNPAHTPASLSNCTECNYCKHTLLASCTKQELEIIHSEKSFRKYKKNEILYLKGEKPQGLHCIYSGKVKTILKNREGKEQIIKIATPGMNIGYQPLVSNSHYSDSCIIMEDAIVCFIPKNIFLKICAENSKLNTELLKLLSFDLVEAEEVIKRMAFKPVRERMADALLLLKKTYNHQGSGSLQIAISRGDLASLVGTAKETTTRLLAEFRDEKIISLEGREVRIIEWEKLRQMSELYN
jgi:CRP-like cAMP-binding protein